MNHKIRIASTDISFSFSTEEDAREAMRLFGDSTARDFGICIERNYSLNGVQLPLALCKIIEASPATVPAIKYLRELTGCGLKAGKDFVDNLHREYNERNSLGALFRNNL